MNMANPVTQYFVKGRERLVAALPIGKRWPVQRRAAVAAVKAKEPERNPMLGWAFALLALASIEPARRAMDTKLPSQSKPTAAMVPVEPLPVQPLPPIPSSKPEVYASSPPTLPPESQAAAAEVVELRRLVTQLKEQLAAIKDQFDQQVQLAADLQQQLTKQNLQIAAQVNSDRVNPVPAVKPQAVAVGRPAYAAYYQGGCSSGSCGFGSRLGIGSGRFRLLPRNR